MINSIKNTKYEEKVALPLSGNLVFSKLALASTDPVRRALDVDGMDMRSLSFEFALDVDGDVFSNESSMRFLLSIDSRLTARPSPRSLYILTKSLLHQEPRRRVLEKMSSSMKIFLRAKLL